jgi:hypothetical protein
MSYHTPKIEQTFTGAGVLYEGTRRTCTITARWEFSICAKFTYTVAEGSRDACRTSISPPPVEP